MGSAFPEPGTVRYTLRARLRTAWRRVTRKGWRDLTPTQQRMLRDYLRNTR